MTPPREPDVPNRRDRARRPGRLSVPTPGTSDRWWYSPVGVARFLAQWLRPSSSPPSRNTSDSSSAPPLALPGWLAAIVTVVVLAGGMTQTMGVLTAAGHVEQLQSSSVFAVLEHPEQHDLPETLTPPEVKAIASATAWYPYRSGILATIWGTVVLILGVTGWLYHRGAAARRYQDSTSSSRPASLAWRAMHFIGDHLVLPELKAFITTATGSSKSVAAPRKTR